MRTAFLALLGLLSGPVACAQGLGQESWPGLAGPVPACTQGPMCGGGCGNLKCLRWTWGCFPRHGCPDDYCPNPCPRQCWPPYPPFYQCVPAGACTHPPCVGVGNERLTWWFIPTPRALHEALWCQP